MEAATAIGRFFAQGAHGEAARRRGPALAGEGSPHLRARRIAMSPFGNGLLQSLRTGGIQEMDREGGNGPKPEPPAPQPPPCRYWAAWSCARPWGRRRRWRPRGWRFPWIPYLESNGRDRQAAVPSGQSSTVARNVTRDGRLEGPPAVASWRHRVGRLVTLLPPGGVAWQAPMPSSGGGSRGATGRRCCFQQSRERESFDSRRLIGRGMLWIRLG
jgi:hypothetical protein